jgi:molybdate transport system substrate-binding protein
LKVFNNAKLKVTPATLEPDVMSVLNKVEMGEADAGIVYVTDALAAGTKVLGITIPAADNASTTYPIVALSTGSNSALAQAFVAYVLSADGLAALATAGFARP